MADRNNIARSGQNEELNRIDLFINKRPQAARDIEECFVYIAEENLDAGVYVPDAVKDSLEQIAGFPGIGGKREIFRTRDLKISDHQKFRRQIKPV